MIGLACYNIFITKRIFLTLFPDPERTILVVEDALECSQCQQKQTFPFTTVHNVVYNAFLFPGLNIVKGVRSQLLQDLYLKHNSAYDNFETVCDKETVRLRSICVLATLECHNLLQKLCLLIEQKEHEKKKLDDVGLMVQSLAQGSNGANDDCVIVDEAETSHCQLPHIGKYLFFY